MAAPSVDAAVAADRAPATEAAVGAAPRARLDVRMPDDRLTSWLWAGAVTLVAAVLRFVGLGAPQSKIFDEVYYSYDAHNLLLHGVELNTHGTGPGFVVHPPDGKWLIAIGEWLFGYNSFGWRFASAVIGSLSVLLLVRVGRRMFRSTVLGCVAGLLLSFDGLHFVQSRVAMLDIFLMWWVLAAFACLLVDRDEYRGRLAAAVEAGRDLRDGARGLGVRWWRLGAALCLGIGMASKWNAIWYVPAFALMTFAWDCGARRSASVRTPVRDSLRRELPGLVLAGFVMAAAYLASWTGWFVSPRGWDRHWAQLTGHHVPLVPDPLVSLWEYQREVLHFHTTLTASHPYQSQPWSWLLLGRPVAYYYASPHGCGAASCAREVLAIGTPTLWWPFLAALVAITWRWLARRDWRGAALLTGIGAGLLPWLPFPERTMFLFYALPALPFLVLAMTMLLGMAIGPPGSLRHRRGYGVTAVGAYVVVVIVTFVYFYPVLAGVTIPYDAWHARMWFSTWI